MRASHTSKLRARLLLAALLSWFVLPCAAAQLNVSSIGAGHVIGGHIGGSSQLLPYIRSTQGAGNSRAGASGGVWRGGHSQSPQWGGRAAASGSSGAGH